MRCGIVHFGHKGLTNAQMLLVATSDERFARRENDGKAIVVFVGSRQEVPGSILVIFGRGCWNKTIGVTSYNSDFSVNTEDTITRTRQVQVRQSLGMQR